MKPSISGFDLLYQRAQTGMRVSLEGGNTPGAMYELFSKVPTRKNLPGRALKKVPTLFVLVVASACARGCVRDGDHMR